MRNFGDAVSCRFIDVTSPELAHYPHIQATLRRGPGALPIVSIGGAVRYSGLFSPTFIHRDVAEILGKAGEDRDRRRARAAAYVHGGMGGSGWSGSRVSGRSDAASSVRRRA